MSRKRVGDEIIPKVIKAMEQGATEKHLFKYITHWLLYGKITKQERDMAKAKHEAIISNIFES